MNIKIQTEEILRQVSALINGLSDEQYSALLPVLINNSVGKHVRHIVEFYQCFLNGLQIGCVDYDKRERSLLLETNREFTQNSIENIIDLLKIINDSSIQLTVSHGDSSLIVNTSVFRELAYNIEHTVHHLAIIKIGVMNCFAEIVLPDNMGIASSTIKYQAQMLEN